ncbi:MAG: hypothetical protein IK070_00870 [Clostridia bacterium]|nr:hypothetical protein [Clostridia bacterium]
MAVKTFDLNEIRQHISDNPIESRENLELFIYKLTAQHIIDDLFSSGELFRTDSNILTELGKIDISKINSVDELNGVLKELQESTFTGTDGKVYHNLSTSKHLGQVHVNEAVRFESLNKETIGEDHYFDVVSYFKTMSENAIKIATSTNDAEKTRLLKERAILSQAINIQLSAGVTQESIGELKKVNLKSAKDLSSAGLKYKDDRNRNAVYGVIADFSVSEVDTSGLKKDLDGRLNDINNQIKDLDQKIKITEDQVKNGYLSQDDLDKLNAAKAELLGKKELLNVDLKTISDSSKMDEMYSKIIQGIIKESKDNKKYKKIESVITKAIKSKYGELSPSEIVAAIRNERIDGKSVIEYYLQNEGKSIETLKTEGAITSIPTVSGYNKTDRQIGDVIKNTRGKELSSDELLNVYGPLIRANYSNIRKFADPKYLPIESIMQQLNSNYASYNNKYGKITDGIASVVGDLKTYNSKVGGKYKSHFESERIIFREGIALITRAMIKENAKSDKPQLLSIKEVGEQYISKIIGAMGNGLSQEEKDYIFAESINVITGSDNTRTHDAYIKELINSGTEYNKKDPTKNPNPSECTYQLVQDIVLRREQTLDAAAATSQTAYHDACVANYSKLLTLLANEDLEKLPSEQKAILDTLFEKDSAGKYIKKDTGFVFRDEFKGFNDKGLALKVICAVEFIETDQKLRKLQQLRKNPLLNRTEINKIKKELKTRHEAEKAAKASKKNKAMSTKPTAACWSSPKAQLKFYEGLLESIYKYQTAVAMGVIKPTVAGLSDANSLSDEVEETKTNLITHKEILEHEAKVNKIKHTVMFGLERDVVYQEMESILGDKINDDNIVKVLKDGRMNFTKLQSELGLSDEQLSKLNKLTGAYHKLEVILSGKPGSEDVKKDVLGMYVPEQANLELIHNQDEYDAVFGVAKGLDGSYPYEYKETAEVIIDMGLDEKDLYNDKGEMKSIDEVVQFAEAQGKSPEEIEKLKRLQRMLQQRMLNNFESTYDMANSSTMNKQHEEPVKDSQTNDTPVVETPESDSTVLDDDNVLGQ